MSLDRAGISESPRLLAGWLLALSRKQPLYRFPKHAAHPQENFGSNLNLATLHYGKVVLADSDALCKLRLCHIEASEFSNPSPDRLPVHGSVRCSRLCA